jgi:hypothetical protein
MPITQSEGSANSAAIPLPADSLKLPQGIDRYDIFDVQEAIFGIKSSFPC